MTNLDHLRSERRDQMHQDADTARVEAQNPKPMDVNSKEAAEWALALQVAEIIYEGIA